MNFLAHFHLAWPEEGLIAGGLEGDYFKGRLTGKLDSALEDGIRLHRAIDAHTDSHPRIEALRNQFPKGLRRYAGILIDLSFDHYLTLHWSNYCDVPLEEFTQRVYQTLTTQQSQLSPGAHAMFERMLEHDILNCYDDWNAVPATARRIGTRFSRGNPLLEAQDQLEPLRAQLEHAFLDFYPQLFEFSQNHRAQLN